MPASSSISVLAAKPDCGRHPGIAAYSAPTVPFPAHRFNSAMIVATDPGSPLDMTANLPLPARTGHFRYESGHHGDYWLDLDAIFADPRFTNIRAQTLVEMIGPFAPDVVCGPMTGGALLAQFVALHCGCGFAWTERVVASEGSVRYELPRGQIEVVEGRTVVIVDDVINAGSAAAKTHGALTAARAAPVAIAALLLLGNAIDTFAHASDIDILALERRASNLWLADDCPHCAAGVPLDSVGPA